MAEHVLKTPQVTINSVNLSDHVRQVSIEYSAELQDSTASGDATRSMTVGLKDWTISVEFNQDYSAAEVDATLFGLVGNDTAFPVEVKPTVETRSATNPSYTTTAAVLASYTPVGGTIGSMHTTSISLRPGKLSGTVGTLMRVTT